MQLSIRSLSVLALIGVVFGMVTAVAQPTIPLPLAVEAANYVPVPLIKTNATIVWDTNVTILKRYEWIFASNWTNRAGLTTNKDITLAFTEGSNHFAIRTVSLTNANIVSEWVSKDWNLTETNTVTVYPYWQRITTNGNRLSPKYPSVAETFKPDGFGRIWDCDITKSNWWILNNTQ